MKHNTKKIRYSNIALATGRKTFADRAIPFLLGYMEGKGRDAKIEDCFREVKKVLPCFEFTDSGILLIDDFIDNAKREDLAILEGTDQILTGIEIFNDELNELYISPQIKTKAIKLFIRMIREVNYGQILDLKSKSFNLKNYYKIIYYTTGVHIEKAVEIGCILAGEKNGAKIELFKKILREFAMFGQTWDDTVDYFPKLMPGKTPFTDILNLRPRLPLILAVNKKITTIEELNKLKKSLTKEQFIKKAKRIIFQKEIREEMYKLAESRYKKFSGLTKKLENPTVRVMLSELFDAYMKSFERILL